MKRFLTLALCLMPVTAFAQEDDKSYLAGLLEGYLSGAGRAVTITGFEGALSSRATLKELTIADDAGIWLTLRDVSLDWSRAALLRGEVSVNELTAGEIIVARPPETAASDSLPAAEASGFALPDLPVSINIGKLAAARIELGAPLLGEPLEGTLDARMSLANGEGQADLKLKRTDSGPAGQVALVAGYANATQNLAIDLDMSEAADGIVTRLIGLPGAPAIALTVKGEGPLSDYTADLRLASDGAERLAGKVTLGSGEAGVMRFAADLGGDLAPLFLPEYADFFGNSLTLVTHGTREASGRLMLDALDFKTQAMTLTGNLVLGVDGLPERFDLQGHLGHGGTPVVLPLSTDQVTALNSADLALRYDVAKGEGWTANLRLSGLDRADLTLEAATLAGTGRIVRSTDGIQKPKVEGDFDLLASGIAFADPALAKAVGERFGGTVSLLWQQGAGKVDFPRINLDGADYGLDGSLGIAGLETGITLNGTGTARLGNLARFADLAGQPVSGSGLVTLSGSASVLGGSFDLTGQIEGQDLRIGMAEVDSLLAGPSAITFSVARDETGTMLRQLDIAAHSLTAEITGKLSSAGSDIGATLDFSDLSALGGAYRGKATGTARFTGTAANGNLKADLKGDGLAIGVSEVDSLLRGASVISADAGIKDRVIDLRALTVNAATLNLRAQGTLAETGSDVTATLAFSDLKTLGGGYRGSLQAEAAFTGTAAAGKLTASATGRNLAIGQAEADRVLAGETRLAADLTLDKGLVKINSASLANPQLSAQAQGDIGATSRQVKLQAALANMALLVPEFPGRLSITGTAIDDGKGYTLDLSGTGPGQIAATVKGRLAPGLTSGDLAVAGTAQAALANAFLGSRNVSGGLRFDLRLKGPLQVSSLSGRVQLSDGRLADPALPFALEGIATTADLAGGRATLNASARLSSGGDITAKGTIGTAAPYDANLTAQLRQLELKDPRLYETRVNGTVTVQGGLLRGARIGGDIVLSETELRVPDTGIGAAAGLDGLRHVAEPADVHATRQRAGQIAETAADGSSTSGPSYALDLRVSAPQRLFIRGRGLDAELGGEIHLQGTTDNVVPSGAFNLVRGRLDILGKRLTLSQALMQLEGDFDPYLDILASNESDGIISSVQIKGRATDPTVSFVSQPELPQEEVLARLLFGRDLTSLSAFQAAQLASAVATLAGKGGDGIIGKLRKGFGLDDLDISTDAEGGTSLKAGKYLSANTYTEVEVDQDGQASISLNLDLTDSVTLRGAAGADGETSIGIFKEKDY
ncbi:translocation/assembly module TamB domain-containing protein [Gemmobacter aquatilis]|nr:translocation/assembly module TamB domain-containing protein [Gemmobacter aquatilis]